MNLPPWRRTCAGELGSQKDPVAQAERHRQMYWEFSVQSNQIVGLQCCSDGLEWPWSGSEWRATVCLGRSYGFSGEEGDFATLSGEED